MLLPHVIFCYKVQRGWRILSDAKAAIDAGAWAVVVGTAITHPTSLTSWFTAAIEG